MNSTINPGRQLDAIKKLKEWISHPANDDLLGAHQSAVNKKLRKAGLLADRIVSASKSKPTIGVYGPSQAGKSYLTAKFAENSNGILSVKLDTEYNFLKDINPAGGRESTALVSRFTTDKMNSNQDYPIKATLLNEADIVCILANSYFCDNDEPIYPDADEFEAVLSEVQNQNVEKSFRNSDDAHQIEVYLDQKVFPRDIREHFTPLWDVIAPIYASAPLRERVKVYSLLWNKNKQFSDLFMLLAETIEKLVGVTDVFLQISALLPREKSIIDVSILEHLDNSSDQHEKILCGQSEISIRKSVLSALISELYLEIQEPVRSVFDGADLLDFPGARTRFKKPIGETEEHGVGEFFLRGKIDYLFQKFTIDLKLDALVFCIDPGPLNVRELPNALEDWLALNKTNTVSSDANLFFTLTKFDTHFPDAAGNQSDELQRFENALDSGLRQPFARSETSWPLNWNGRSFKNVFPVRNPNYPLHGYFDYQNGIETAVLSPKLGRLEELKNGFLNAPLVLDHIGEAEQKWSDLVSVNGGGSDYLASAIEKLDLENSKNTNLNYQLQVNAQNLVETLSIFVQSDNAEERLENERLKFGALYKQIYDIGLYGKFMPFLKTLSVSERLIITSIKSAMKFSKEVEEPEKSPSSLDDWRPDILKQTEEINETSHYRNVQTMSHSEKLANSILRSWVNSLSTNYDNATLSRDLNTTAPAFEFLVGHIANEVQISKIRSSLVKRFDDWKFGLTQDANLLATAKIACQEINQHILLQNRSEDRKAVYSGTISKFPNIERANGVQNWRNWLNQFGRLIEQNCDLSEGLQYDRQQNVMLINCLENLEAA